MKTYQTFSSEETKRLGSELTRRVLKVKGQAIDVRRGAKKCSALVFALSGDLGSGKTTFVQGFLKGLGIKKRTSSPTFVLVKRFKVYGLSFKNVYHMDAYRLKKPKELLDLGLEEILAGKENIVLIEWAEKVSRYLPKSLIWVRFKHKKEEERDISVIMN